MAAKRKSLESEIIVTSPLTNFLKTELNQIMPLFRVCQTQDQKDIVLSFYKKYVKKNWRDTKKGCSGCRDSFLDIRNEVRDWVSANNKLFIN